MHTWKLISEVLHFQIDIKQGYTLSPFMTLYLNRFSIDVANTIRKVNQEELKQSCACQGLVDVAGVNLLSENPNAVKKNT